MKLSSFNDKCVRLTTSQGEVFEGIASYCSKEYVLHEYGYHQEALLLVPILFCKNEIASIVSLEEVNGPFGHYSEKYGLLEKTCLKWGTDMIEEVLDSEDADSILRMLICMEENFQSLSDRAVSGMAPWRSGGSASQAAEDDNEQGPIYRGELESMLNSLVKHSNSDEVVNKAKQLLDRLAAPFS